MRSAFACVAAASLCVAATAATTYSNWDVWDGNVTTGWFAQAQRFPVPAGDNVLLNWQSQFDSSMTGMQVGFAITDIVSGVPGGTTYFTANPTIDGTGTVTIASINLALVSGQDYAAVWDFNGYSGSSIHWISSNTAPGNGLWRDQSGAWTEFADFDQRFIANFGVPAPGVAALLGLGAVGALRRRR